MLQRNGPHLGARTTRVHAHSTRNTRTPRVRVRVRVPVSVARTLAHGAARACRAAGGAWQAPGVVAPAVALARGVG